MMIDEDGTGSSDSDGITGGIIYFTCCIDICHDEIYYESMIWQYTYNDDDNE
jgi:hypothetical protein